MYSVMSGVLDVIHAVFEGYCLQYFYGSFLESRFLKGKWNSLLVAFVYGGFRLGLNLILTSDYESVKIILRQILILLVLSAVSICFYRAVHLVTIFLVITFAAVDEISFFISYAGLQAGSRIFVLWEWCFGKGCISSLDQFEMILEITVMVLQFLLLFLYALLLYFSLKSIVGNFKEKDYKIHKTELLFLVIPGMVGLLICMLLRIITITVEEGIPRLLYEKYPLLLILVPVILILSLLSVLYGIRLFQSMICLNRERSDRIILENQISSMQEHLAEMEHVYAGVRSMKHDMNNTLSVIMQLAAGHSSSTDEEEENVELQKYLAELNRTMERVELRFKTGSSVVDALLNMKYHEIIRTLPELKLNADDLIFPPTLLIQSYDMGIIIGNALDNAIEACRKLKEKEEKAEIFIRLSSFGRGKMFFIEVENSFTGDVIRRKQNEFPVTDKKDKEVHGIGLSNIQKVVQKYHGAVDWWADNKIFTISIMMQNERSVEK